MRLMKTAATQTTFAAMQDSTRPAMLEGQAAGLAPDCAPWLHVAKQILAGEFVGADSSTVASLTIGLRSITHPLCQQALCWLKSHAPTSR
jgi:hypothetical protein